MVIARRLIQLRESRKMEITELANEFHIDRKTIWRAETGRFMPKTELLLLYAKYFDVSMDYLTGLIDKPLKLSERKS